MTNPAEPAAEALAEGLAHHIELWARRHTDDGAVLAAVRRAAHDTSLALSDGHVCLRLAGGDAVLRERLLASGVVGTPEAPGAMPLILDAGGRLYLHRHFDAERRLARRLLRAAVPEPAGDAAIDCLHALFGEAADGETIDWQKIAVALALTRRLVVISGGPGTGKTRSVALLLACLLAQHDGLRIALAAPTGKAAARLGEALRRSSAALPAPLRARMPATAQTVHRLLGAHPRGFAHDAEHPLPIDLLVVDEASMLDLALATRLLDAVPDAARIVLLGDKDQLAAVEAGAVFAEISADPTLGEACRDELARICGVAPQQIATPEPARPTALHDTAVWYSRNYRFGAGSAIARCAEHIRDGRTQPLLAELRGAGGGGDGSVHWLDDPQPRPSAAALQAVADGYAPFVDALRDDAPDVAAVTRAYERFRVLCAQREGPRSVAAINACMSQRLQPLPGASPWYVGRPVMVRRNDALLKLFNGDIGITLRASSGELEVFFADAATGGFRALAPMRLPPHETAFAMTVHKAQGSEFDGIVLLLPEPSSRVLTRELLYTAVTRARARVVIAGSAASIAAAVDAPAERMSGLRERLKEASREPDSGT